MTPEGTFLLGQINGTLESLDATDRASADSAILEYYLKTPSHRRYALKLIHRETNAPTLLEMLRDAKEAVNDSTAGSPTSEESADPSSALIGFINANACDQAKNPKACDQTKLDAILDAVGKHLPGEDPDKPLSQLSDAEMARTLLQESAQANQVEDLRESLRRVNRIARA